MAVVTEQAPVHTASSDRIASSVASLSCAILTLYSWYLVLSAPPTKLGWFAFHPTLMTLAFSAFTYSILTLQPTSLQQPQAKIEAFGRHKSTILYAGFPVAFLGVSAIWYNKQRFGARHFTTWHGTYGGIATAYLIIQTLFGLASVWNGGALLGGGMRAKGMYKYHRASGYILMPLLLLAIHLAGAWSSWTMANSSLQARVIVYTLAPIGIMNGLYTRARADKMKIFS